VKRLSALGTLAFLTGAYFVLRYLGLWSENDTAVFRQMIFNMQQAATIDPPNPYTHGYAYQALASTLLGLTGLTLKDYLQLYSPVLGSLLLALFGYVTYARYLTSRTQALVASSVLFLVPELLFTVLRGNHEKFTVTLTLLAALLFLRLLTPPPGVSPVTHRVTWGAALALCFFALNALNLFFGSTFLISLTLTLLILLTLNVPLHLRLTRTFFLTAAAVVLGGWCLVTLDLLFVYPPARSDFSLLTTASQKLLDLLNFKSATFNPYTAIQSDWSNPVLYQFVTAFRWVLLGSAVLNTLLEFRAFRRSPGAPDWTRVLMAGFFAASLVQLAAAVGVDLLGLAAGSNLQVRLYSYVVLWAAPQFVLFVVRVSRRVTVPGGPAVRGAALLAVFAVLLSSSVLKSTLDPVLSNRWLGYHPSEVQAVRTWTQHSQSSSIWVGIDARVVFAYVAESGVTVPRFNSLSAIPAERVGSGFALQSPLTLSNNRVWNLPLPELLLGDRIYDNGTSQILWRHPLTQFQR